MKKIFYAGLSIFFFYIGLQVYWFIDRGSRNVNITIVNESQNCAIVDIALYVDGKLINHANYETFRNRGYDGYRIFKLVLLPGRHHIKTIAQNGLIIDETTIFVNISFMKWVHIRFGETNESSDNLDLYIFAKNSPIMFR